MADFLLRNTLNPSKVVKCTITFRQVINKGEEGEPVWLIEIGTLEPHKNGGDIVPIFIHYTSKSNLDEEIRQATEEISEQIDWGITVEDLRPPFVICSFPTKSTEIVDIYSKVVVDIKDIFPAAGIDPDSIEVIVNDIDVSDEIKLVGTPYQYRIIWEPKIRVFDYY